MPLGSANEGKRFSFILWKDVSLMVPMKYKGLGFERYDSDAYNKEAVATMKALVAEAAKGAFVYGPPGTGKSMLVAVFANEKQKAGTDTMFLTAAELFSETVGAANETERAKFCAKVESVPCLVVDDLDAAHLVKEAGEALIGLLKTRGGKNLQSIVASKFPLSDVPKKTEGVGEELHETLKSLGEHIVLK
ncbi:MAG: ATP-binding protein [Lachnospiraceae bacterium]|nr:ATP-binding protein [Lachnospiraceae bacterium]